MREWLRFEVAVLKHAANRSAKTVWSSANSILRAAVTAAVVASAITGSLAAASWWPVLGAVGLAILTFLWHQSLAPYRLWLEMNARIEALEVKVGDSLDTLAKARELEEYFRVGEKLLSQEVVRHAEFRPWSVKLDVWAASVSALLAGVHERERFAFDSLSFDNRARTYRLGDEPSKHSSRQDDLTTRLSVLRGVIDRLYGRVLPVEGAGK